MLPANPSQPAGVSDRSERASGQSIATHDRNDESDDHEKKGVQGSLPRRRATQGTIALAGASLILIILRLAAPTAFAREQARLLWPQRDDPVARGSMDALEHTRDKGGG